LADADDEFESYVARGKVQDTDKTFTELVFFEWLDKEVGDNSRLTKRAPKPVFTFFRPENSDRPLIIVPSLLFMMAQVYDDTQNEMLQFLEGQNQRLIALVSHFASGVVQPLLSPIGNVPPNASPGSSPSLLNSSIGSLQQVRFQFSQAALLFANTRNFLDFRS
jgi:hypothetical protein